MKCCMLGVRIVTGIAIGYRTVQKCICIEDSIPNDEPTITTYVPYISTFGRSKQAYKCIYNSTR